MSQTETETPLLLATEEIANAITHGLGLALSFVGLVALLTLAWRTGDYWHKWSAVIYGSSLVLLYGASTLYHSARQHAAKKMLRVADHCGIYLLIAGSYTPFLLGPLREGIWGWPVFWLVWGAALTGIAVRASGRHFRVASVTSYVVLGWVGALLIKPLLQTFAAGAVTWIIAGGIAYMLGIIFYGGKFWRYNHAVWHIFVMAGSLCHFYAVVAYVLQ